MANPKTKPKPKAKPKKVVSVAPARKGAVKAVLDIQETRLRNDFTKIKINGKVGDAIARPGLEKKYPGPKRAGLSGYDRSHMVGPDAMGAEEGIVYAPENFNLSKTAEIENVIRSAQEQAKIHGTEVYFEVEGIVKEWKDVDGVKIRVLKEMEWTIEFRLPGSDKLITLVSKDRVFLKPPPSEPNLWSGYVPEAAMGIASFAAPIIVQKFIHKPAVEHRIEDQAKKEGYVSFNAPSEKGFLYDLGAWLLDPFRDAEFSVGMDKRFNVKIWRDRLKAAANAKKPGETFEIEWDVGLCKLGGIMGAGRQVIETRKIVYRKQPDNSWVVESGDPSGTPDLNFILSDSNSDPEVEKRLFFDPCVV